MEFIVRWAKTDTRTSAHPYHWWKDDNGMPFAHVKDGAMLTDSRPLTKGYEDLKFYPAFTAEGINHRIEGDQLKREIADTTRYIEIGSLEDLLALQKKVDLPLKVSHIEPYGILRVNGTNGDITQVPEKWVITIDDSEVSYPVLM